MTAGEFCALARATGLSDARLGLALGAQGSRKNISARVRQWKRGARPVPPEIASKLRALTAALGGVALADSDDAVAGIAPALPPEWIIGTAAPGTDEEAPEYLVHTARPRFICRVVDELSEPAPLSALAYADGDTVLCDFVWLDREPEGEDLRRLCERAMAALGGAAVSGRD
jgi:hypothetical protein